MIRQVRMQKWIDAKCLGIGHQYRMSVCRRAQQLLHRWNARSARFVLDDETLTKFLSELRRNNPRNDVGRPTCGVRYQNAYGLRRIGLSFRNTCSNERRAERQ